MVELIYLLNRIPPFLKIAMEKNDSNRLLAKILNSQTFTNKEVMKGLLNYLYEVSAKGLAMKEVDIAFGFFKRTSDFVPGDDTIVRVNIHKLRSLLDTYYREEGKKDQWVLEIPKGSYNIKFVKRGQATVKRISLRKRNKILYAAILLSLLCNLFFISREYVFNQTGDNPVWSAYIKAGKPVYVTLADPFFFRVNDSVPETVIVRDINVNSPDELIKDTTYLFDVKHPHIKELTYPYFSTNNVLPLPDIISVFAKANIEVRLQALSKLNVEDIKQNNGIFIGNINSFGYMNRFLDQTSIRLFTNPRRIILHKDTEDLVLSVPEYIHGYYMDYAFLVKIPGPYNNLITMMGDFHASGIKGLTNYITSPSTLSVLEKRVKKDYGRFPKYFEMVVKVTSYNYVDFKTEVIHFKAL